MNEWLYQIMHETAPENINVQVGSTSGSGTHNYGATANENSPPTGRVVIIIIVLLSCREIVH